MDSAVQVGPLDYGGRYYYSFTASEEAAAQAVLELAAGTIEEDGFCQFMRANAKRT